MKKRVYHLSLSKRAVLLLIGFGICAAIFSIGAWYLHITCSTAVLGLLLGSVCFVLLLWAGVLAPLRQAERLLLEPQEEAEETPCAQKMEAALQRHPMGRALLALERTIGAQYTEDLLSKQATLDVLQSQINPHFLYNTLDSIRGQALQEGARDIADMTEALSTFFRYSISNRKGTVSLEEELENVKNYFKIQQFRFNNRFTLEILPTEHENLEQCHLPKLTLQPILENTILHGMEGKLGEGTIQIQIEGTEHLILITVSDDGMGMTEDTLLRLQAKLRGTYTDAAGNGAEKQRSTGMALSNIVQRIHLLYGEAYGMQIMSTLGAGTDVRITLPRVIRDEEQHEA